MFASLETSFDRPPSSLSLRAEQTLHCFLITDFLDRRSCPRLLLEIFLKEEKVFSGIVVRACACHYRTIVLRGYITYHTFDSIHENTSDTYGHFIFDTQKKPPPSVATNILSRSSILNVSSYTTCKSHLAYCLPASRAPIQLIRSN